MEGTANSFPAEKLRELAGPVGEKPWEPAGPTGEKPPRPMGVSAACGANAASAPGAPDASDASGVSGTPATPTDCAFMRRALALACRAAGRTNPNPLVGAVIVRDGRIIGEGWHEHCGQPHAERNALADCAARGEDPRGATVYVTLEPCSHQGRQPPCADALVEAGVARVVVGSADPNPLVAGRGIARLQAAGIEVAQGIERDACDAINQVFFHYIAHRTPYVLAKWAMTADGRIACASGDARWVTGPAARADAHALRNRLAAVMVGIGTVIADDPLLTCRIEDGRNPVRVVCDSRLALPEDCALVRSAARGEAPLLVACAADSLGTAGAPYAPGAFDASGTSDALSMPATPDVAAVPAVPATPDVAAALADVAPDTSGMPGDLLAQERARKAARLAALGVEVLPLPRDAAGGVDLHALMAALAAREIDSVLLEGGARLHAAAFEAGIVNEAVAYVAPKIVGGADAPGPLAGAGVARMADARRLGSPHVDVLGDDVRICWRVGATEADRALPCVAQTPLTCLKDGE